VRRLAFIAGYGLQGKVGTAREVLAQGLVREAAVEKRRILVEGAPAGYVNLSSGLGEGSPTSIVIIPIVFEDTLLGVMELASFSRFSDVHLAFFDQFVNTIGFAINTILANTRTETLLNQSQRLATQLQERSDELQRQQIELQHSNEKLAEKAALLSAASQYKSEFLAKMSHELRTPLTSMLIYARLLGDNPHKSLSEEELAFATSIYSAGSDLLQLINDILDLSRVEVGRLDLRSTKLPLVKLIDYVNTTFRPIADVSGLDFRVEVSDDAPQEICSDEQRVEQILRNLLSNAIKFTSAGWVKLRVERVGDAVLDGARDVIGFTVEDTGIGIPRDKLTVIFEAFEQADPGSCHKYGGTGLGLSISRELAALLGGRIIAESQPGKGSAFTLYLPVRPGDAPAYEPEPERELTEERTPTTRQALTAGDMRWVSDDEEPSGRQPIVNSPAEHVAPRLPGKVLIVDDDLRTIGALTKLLARSGVPALYALNGQEGIEVLQHNPDVSLVLMDIMMPVMDGNEAISAIRRIPGYANLPITVLSAKAIPGEREKALAGGANEYLQKPVVDLDQLLKIACDPPDAERAEKPPTTDGDTGDQPPGEAHPAPLDCWVGAFTRRFRRRRNTR
jgi:signal transduction histidine kinase/ActR/RegA family two-component response regulator